MRSFFPCCLTIVFLVSLSCGRKHKKFYTAKYPFVDFTLSVHNSFQLKEMYGDSLFGAGFVQFVDSVDTEPGERFPAWWDGSKDTSHIDKKKLLIKPGAVHVTIMRKNQWNLSLYSGIQIIKQDTLVSYGITQAKDSVFRNKYFNVSALWMSHWNKQVSYSEETKNGNRLLKIALGNPQSPSILYAGMIGKYWFQAWFQGNEKDRQLLQQMWEQSYFD